MKRERRNPKVRDFSAKMHLKALSETSGSSCWVRGDDYGCVFVDQTVAVYRRYGNAVRIDT
jgi:hypothetical protein